MEIRNQICLSERLLLSAESEIDKIVRKVLSLYIAISVYIWHRDHNEPGLKNDRQGHVMIV